LIGQINVISEDQSLMNADSSQTVTMLLYQARGGNGEAFNRLFESVYDELRRLAGKLLYGKQDVTLNTTALVHEAYLKLIPEKEQNWKNRAHFFHIAARAMRQVLIKQARYKNAEKRNAVSSHITFNEELISGYQMEPEILLSLDQALTRLEIMSERQSKIVECRFFAGMSVRETAEAFGVSEPTVKREWRLARAWLIRELDLKEVQ
jgi:RNA polymerase sigma factor (TIGR02999 family)